MNETIVIKLGGIASDSLKTSFFSTIKKWQIQGKHVVVVHGGGHFISEMMANFNLKSESHQGLRVTNHQVLEITKMVLIGQVQPMITSLFSNNKLQAVGLNAASNHLLEGQFIDRKTLGFVGEISEVKTDLIKLLTNKGYIPVIAPLGMTKTGEWLNVNADQAACKIAEKLHAHKLYLLTDVPGVKYQDKWLKEISAEMINQLQEEQVIIGGMLPKIRNGQRAKEAGIREVIITNNIETMGTIFI